MAGVESMNNGFLVIPFKLPTNDKLNLFENTNHYMFVKKHQSKNENEKQCLFLVNLPLLTNLESLKYVFSSVCQQYDTVAHISQLLYYDEFGLQDVDLSSLTSDLINTDNSHNTRFTPRNTALLQFIDDSSLDNCWSSLKKYSQIKKKQQLITWQFHSPSISTFTSFYKPLDVEYLKNDIYTHMSNFEQLEQQAQEDVQSTIVDEDGFTLVVGKNTKSLNSVKKKILHRNPLLKHEKVIKMPNMVDKKAKQDFYRFQVRERKKQEVNELLKKFKQDQERIKIMKSKKKFNPYN